jgi:hypothetical protein
MSLVAKMETGELKSKDVDNFILKQHAETVRAGQLALLDAIELQEMARNGRFKCRKDPKLRRTEEILRVSQ